MRFGKLMLALAALLGAVAVGVYTRAGGGRIDGLYIIGLNMHDTYIVVKTDGRGNPHVEQPDPQDWKFDRTPGGFRLYGKIEGLAKFAYQSELIPDPQTGEKVWAYAFDIVPSASTPGDWDILGSREFGSPAMQVNWKLKTPLPSFLHCIDDLRALELIKTTAAVRAEEWGNPEQAIQGNPYALSPILRRPPLRPHDDLTRQAASLAEAHPNDAFIEVLRMDALLAARDFKALETDIAKWHDRLERPSFMRSPFRRAELTLHAHQLSMAGKNAYDFFATLFNPNAGLAQLLTQFPTLLNYREYAAPMPVMMSLPKVVPHFLEAQTISKVLTVMGTLQLLTGQRSQALATFAATYRMGQLFNASDQFITKLIGVAVRAIACRGLELIALNGCESQAEASDVWRQLEALNAEEGRYARGAEMFRLEAIANWYPERQDEYTGILDQNMPEAVTRQQVSNTRFQLVRMGAAARYHQLASGVLPGNAREFSPPLASGLPADPFTSAPLRMAPAPAGIVCYSVGPDRLDDGGAIAYDPSNGTLSRGDIPLEVTRARKYPFPRGGVRANSPAELLAQFPNGLPLDPFADARTKQLSVTGAAPVYVYSFGPDTDQNVIHAQHPQVMYDPTNGTVSDGDLWIRIPGR